MQTVLITGGTGMVGKSLTNYLLAKGYKVIVLSRSKKKSIQQHLSYAIWDIDKQFIDISAINEADIIVHLAGESVASKRWSDKRKQEIIDSRVKSGALLVKALNENNHKVKTLIAASAIGW
jgi:NAD dependent epimerase/dehydratase family enzyme